MPTHPLFRARILVFTLFLGLIAYPDHVRAAQQGGAVVFRVDMRYTSMQPGDRLVVRGDVAALGTWTGEPILLKQRGQSTVYTGRLGRSVLATGTTFAYKFVLLKADGREVWEERANRQGTVQATRHVLDVVFFSDAEEAGTATAQTVAFEVDLRGARFNDEVPEAVAVAGGRSPLSWTLETDGHLLTDNDADGIWKGTVTFSAGSLPDIPFKMAYQLDGRWIWESLPGHSNHLFLVQSQVTPLTLRLHYDTTQNRLVPQAGSDGLLDRYAAIIRQLGQRGAQSEYTYYLAMHLLDKGQRNHAQQVYTAFREHWPEGRDTDDFYYEWAGKLAQEGRLQEALAFCRQRAQQTNKRKRRAYFSYLEGELLLQAGQHRAAQTAFRRVLSDFNDETEARDYSQYGLAVSYLADPATAAQAATPLEALATSTAPEPKRRMAWRHLAHLHESQGDTLKAQTAREQLTQTGTAIERWKARFRNLRRQAQHLPLETALANLQTLLDAAPHPKLEAEGLFLQARLLRKARRTDEAQTLERTLRQRHPRSRHSRQ